MSCFEEFFASCLWKIKSDLIADSPAETHFFRVQLNSNFMTITFSQPGVAALHTYESGVRQATCAVKNLILAMNSEKTVAQMNFQVPVKKVV